MKIIVKTFEGLEPVLENEMKDLGFSRIVSLKRAVAFEGEKEALYLANYLLRTALRVLVPVFEFKAQNEEQLYQKAYNYNWSKHLNLKQTFAIDSNVNSLYFKHSKYVALKIKDAVVDQFRKRSGRRPSVDVEDPDLRFNVRIFKDTVTISLDSSGHSLHRRGYRVTGHAAPLNEVLAAGMILSTDWNRNQTFLDPMCGSGTLLMEAAMIGNRVPTGYLDHDYGFKKWNDFDKVIWDNVVSDAWRQMQKDALPIFGADAEYRAYALASSIVKKHHFSRFITITKKNFSSYHIHSEDGIIIMNPPYDVRMKVQEISNFYQMIGDTLKNNYKGWTAWIFSGNLDAAKSVGLRPSRKITLHNGSIPCKFLKYELYDGSKKSKFN